MSFISGTSPWQLEPVSSLGRITAAALVALAVDVLFAWQISPVTALPVAGAVALLLVAVRVIRGFEGSLSAAAVAFGLTGFAAAGLVLVAPTAATVRSALVVAIVLAVVGSIAALAAWAERPQRRDATPVIEIAVASPDGLARARRRPRVYR